jgi:hypothetical protein
MITRLPAKKGGDCMELNVTPGLVFWYLYDTSRKYQEAGYPPLEQYLPVEHDRLIRWIRDQEPIDDDRLEKALAAFDVDSDTYQFLCSL